MSAFPLFSAQAQALIQSYTTAKSSYAAEKELRTLQEEICSLAHAILHSDIQNEDTINALSLINRVTPNTYHGDKRLFLYLNIKDRFVPPAQTSTPYPYAKQTPFIASYHTQAGAHSLLARLDARSCWHLIPRDLLASLGGGLNLDAVDMFFIQDEMRNKGVDLVGASREALLKFHAWIFPDLSIGKEGKKALYMGAFPSFGVYGASYWPAPINHMEPMEVCAHPADIGTDMLYSPDGAHIALDIHSAFAELWIAAREGDRCCIAKMVLKTYDPLNRHAVVDRVFEEYFNLPKDCSSAEDYIVKLTRFKPSIEEYARRIWQPLVETLENRRDPHAYFYSLPFTFQAAFFKQLWILKGCPEGYGDFGRLCFEGHHELPPELRASGEDKIRVAQLLQALMIKILIDEPLELLQVKLPQERAFLPQSDRPMGGAGDSLRIKTAAATVLSSPPSPTTEIKDLITLLKAAKAGEASQEDLETLLSRLDSKSPLLEGKKASHRLFALVYEQHMALKEDLELPEPSHLDFGRAAFFGIEGAKTHIFVIDMSLDLLEAELRAALRT